MKDVVTIPPALVLGDDPALARASSSEPPDAAAVRETVVLLDGGAQAYPRMLGAISAARRAIHLEVYSFSATGVGVEFVDALRAAAQRGVAVHVKIDGWGSMRGGRHVAARLRTAGCEVDIHNRLVALFVGRLGRNHRKVLLVDDGVAFVGGINIGDENIADEERLGWADVAVEIRGPLCVQLGRQLRGEPPVPVASGTRILLSGPGGGWRLRRWYVDAFAGARHRIDLAHGYFAPDRRVIRALTMAAQRGVDVRLLMAGHSDVPLARIAARSFYRRLLGAGVRISEWTGSVLHAKVATVDGRRLLVGSFNLDAFSLSNLEVLLVLEDASAVAQAQAWIASRFDASPPVTPQRMGGWRETWILEPAGRRLVAIVALGTRLAAGRRRRRGRRPQSDQDVGPSS
mgnify:CR=1 FL=1